MNVFCRGGPCVRPDFIAKPAGRTRVSAPTRGYKFTGLYPRQKLLLCALEKGSQHECYKKNQ